MITVTHGCGEGVEEEMEKPVCFGRGRKQGKAPKKLLYDDR